MYRFCTTSVRTHSCFPGSRVLAWCGNKKINKFRYSRDGGLVLRVPRGKNPLPALRSGHEVLAFSPKTSRFARLSLPTKPFLIASHRNIRNRANSLNKKEKPFSNRYFFGTLCEFQRRLCTLPPRALRCATPPRGDPSSAQSIRGILRYTARHHECDYFHAARRQRRRPQQNQNGPAARRVRIAGIL